MPQKPTALNITLELLTLLDLSIPLDTGDHATLLCHPNESNTFNAAFAGDLRLTTMQDTSCLPCIIMDPNWPGVRNSLPPHVTYASSVNIFKTHLKSFLFSRSFP